MFVFPWNCLLSLLICAKGLTFLHFYLVIKSRPQGGSPRTQDGSTLGHTWCFCKRQSCPIRDKQELKKSYLLPLSVHSHTSAGCLKTDVTDLKDQKSLQSWPALLYTATSTESAKTPADLTYPTSGRIFFEREMK